MIIYDMTGVPLGAIEGNYTYARDWKLNKVISMTKSKKRILSRIEKLLRSDRERYTANDLLHELRDEDPRRFGVLPRMDDVLW